jgi:hypothetical protein
MNELETPDMPAELDQATMAFSIDNFDNDDFMNTNTGSN